MMEDKFEHDGTTIVLKTIPAEDGQHTSICACRTFNNFHTVHDDMVAWVRELAEFLTVSADQMERMPKVDLCSDLTPYLSGQDAETYAWLKQQLASKPN